MKNLFHYKITVNFISPTSDLISRYAKPREVILFESVTDVPLDRRSASTQLDIVRPIVYKAFGYSSVRNADKVSGNVCVCCNDDNKKAGEYIDLVRKSGAVAIITLEPSLSDRGIPLFCLPRDVVCKLDRWAVSTVVIEEVTGSSAGTWHVTANDSVEVPFNGGTARGSTNLPGQIRNKATQNNPTYSDMAQRNTSKKPVSREETRYDRPRVDAPSNADYGAQHNDETCVRRHHGGQNMDTNTRSDETSNRGGWGIGGFMKAGVDLVGSGVDLVGSVFKQDPELIRVFNGLGWSPNKRYEAYNNAIVIVRSYGSSRCSHETVAKVIEWLQGRTEGIGPMRFCVCMELWKQSGKCNEALFCAIVLSFAKWSIETKITTSLEARNYFFSDSTMKPHVLFRRLFAAMVQEFVRLGGKPAVGRILGEEEIVAAFWMKSLFFWYDSGSLNGAHWGVWRHLQVLMDPGFAVDHGDAMLEFMSLQRVQTTCLFLQDSISRLHCTFRDLEQDDAKQNHVVLEAHVADWVVKLLEGIVQDTWSHDQGSSDDWCKAFDVISACDLDPPRRLQDLLSRLAALASYKERQSFSVYPLITTGSAHSPLHSMTMDVLGEALKQDLASNSLALAGHLVDMLQFSLGTTFLQGKRFWAVVHFVERFVRHTTADFGVKLKLLMVIHSEPVSGRQGSYWSGGRCDQWVREQLEKALKGHSCSEKLLQSTALARKFGTAFESSEPTSYVGFAGQVSECIVGSVSGVQVIKNIRLIKTELVMLAQSTPKNKFQCGLERSLVDALVEACSSIKDASNVLPQFAFGYESCAVSKHIAEHVFSRSFDAWKPTSLGQIASLNTAAVDFCTECLRLENTQHGLHPFKECLFRLLYDWLDMYQAETIHIEDLRKGVQYSKSRLWSVVNKQNMLQLPSTSSINSKITEYSDLLESITASLSEPSIWNSSLPELLKAYKCPIADESDYGRIISMYCTSDQSDKKASVALAQLRKDAGCAESIRSSFWPALSTCDFFLQNKSLIFERTFEERWEVHRNLEGLKVSVESAISEIKALFEANCSFEDFNAIFSAITASKNASLEHECNVLFERKEIGLTEETISRFLFVGTMCSIKGPFKDWLNFCEQVKCDCIRDDMFLELKTFEASLQSTSISVATVHDLCGQLHASLRPAIEREASAIAEINELGKIFTCLGSFSRHSEVWVFVREMRWFGRDGLQQFYKEHENVTNVLLGNVSHDYYMNVLDALEPTVRVISALGGLLKEGNVVAFLKKVSTSPDVKSWVTGSTKDNLEVVQDSLSLLRRWFCDGVDEIASLNTAFEAIQSSGVYSICTTTSGVSLQLVYEADSQAERRSVLGRELEELIEQVEMIQNDESADSHAVECFLEQYRIMKAAVSNIGDSDAFGYPIGGLLSISCRAGESYLSEANEILRRSQLCHQSKKSWLQSTRNQYPFSLLFWTEELKEIQSLLDPARSDETALARLVAKLSRLDSNLTGEKVQQVISRYSNDVNPQAEEGWLVEASRFLECAGQTVGASTSSDEEDKRGGSVQLHTISCEKKNERRCILAVLQHIYKDRLPFEYEILDGLSLCSTDELDLFLQRSKAFRGSVFVIINVDKLSGEGIEMLVDFVSDHDNNSLGIQLHFVQCNPTILHASSYVEGKSWDENNLQVNSSAWKNSIIAANRIRKASIVVSDTCGAGKTRLIRKELDKISRHGEVGAITVHEGSTADSLADDAMAIFTEGGSKQRALHMSFMCMLFSESEAKCKWLDEINNFFFSLLIKGMLRSGKSSKSFQLGKGGWDIFVEFPSDPGSNGSLPDSVSEWLEKRIPALSLCGEVIMPESQLAIDEETRRVCTYLRAYENGTINRTFQSQRKKVAFVLDCSGSMCANVGDGKSALAAAVDCALQIFDTHLNPNDLIGVKLFESSPRTVVPMQEISDSSHKSFLRGQLYSCRSQIRGGTMMYRALEDATKECQRSHEDMETWIVCLTDGCTGDEDTTFRPLLETSSDNLNVIMVGVNLPPAYETQMRLLCNKYRSASTQPSKGLYISSRANIESLSEAFQKVANCIPVSETFELDGRVTDDECWRLIKKYAPDSLDHSNMQQFMFWVRFLHRRVKVLDKNHEFNYNEKFEGLGSSLMDIMLFEVDRLLGNDLCCDWINTNYTQLIYDFEDPESPKFRLLCTSRGNLDPATRQRYEDLTLPGFSVPTENQLRSTRVLCEYLSQALDIPVGDRDCLNCIEENRFVLTLDFTIKMLSLHERVATGIPAILEGETGVSKTALTKMYSILQNLSNSLRAEKMTDVDLKAIEQEIERRGHHTGEGDTALSRLQRALESAAEHSREDSTDLSELLFSLVNEKCEQRPAIFETKPEEFGTCRTQQVHAMLQWFASSKVQPTFFEINVDQSMSDSDVCKLFDTVRQTARKLKDENSLVIVFLDEINTSSVLGLFKEIVVDRSLHGVPLEDNIVAVAACNPVRAALCDPSGERDLGKRWASGHYQVVPLPKSMEQLKWSFGSLGAAQEQEFISRRLEMMGRTKISPALCGAITSLIASSQEAVRQLAVKDLTSERAESEVSDLRQRASSVVSLRDIQRVFSLFDFIEGHFHSLGLTSSTHVARQRRAMLLAVAIVYYMRLDCASRREFVDVIQALPGEELEDESIEDVLEIAMQAVVANTIIPAGIAATRGLAENLFMTLICTLSRTPLMIVGPPGSSKTLSVNMLSDNANGEDSPNPFYREFARLILYHYQCSAKSTSPEIAAVFHKAGQRQEKVDPAKQRCVVFLDEAGLTEAEKESLKVLHYLLEGHMSILAAVGFVAITNHILDAAKSNRCVVLLRPKPTEKEMTTIVSGLLFDRASDGVFLTREVELGEQVFAADAFARQICSRYTSLVEGVLESGLSSSNQTSDDAGALVAGRTELETFFGLRDFIYFLKSLKSSATNLTVGRIHIPFDCFVRSIERNFNGLGSRALKQIIFLFLQPFSKSLELSKEIAGQVRLPFYVLRESLEDNCAGVDQKARSRFTLIIDSSEDDSIMRLLQKSGLLNVTKKSLFKLSHMPEEASSEQLRCITGVKFAAGQGNLAVLSQTEPINESFYDLTNQNFRVVSGRDGDKSLFTNIAVGGESWRSKVKPEFECIIHARSSKVPELPAPFLNRFEKFRLDIKDVLAAGISKLGGLALVIQRARAQTNLLLQPLLVYNGLFGWASHERTLDSIFVEILPSWSLACDDTLLEFDARDSHSFAAILADFMRRVTSLGAEADDLVKEAITVSCQSLPLDEKVLLEQICQNSSGDRTDPLQHSLSNLLVRPAGDVLGRLCQSLLQIAITRHAVTILMRLAKPETVLSQRHQLPTEIFHDFLMQPSSLKRLVGEGLKCCDKLRLIVAHTRSDEFAICLPTLPPNTDWALMDKETNEKVALLVSDSTEEVVIERLELLRSEAKLRNSVLAWIQHPRKRVYVLLVDMKDRTSVEQCNYVRMHVEQHVSVATNSKLFLLLLHYPPLVSLRSNCYPALPLGGWHHYFLDGVGQMGPEMETNDWIKIICFTKDGSEASEMTERLHVFLKQLLPLALARVACRQILHPLQTHQAHDAESDPFFSQFRALKALLDHNVGLQTVGDILCQKFANEWIKNGLPNAAQAASNGLLQGTTQLSMGAAIQSTATTAFETFLLLSLEEMNKDQNLSVLMRADTCTREVEGIFGYILENLTTIPTDGILMHQEVSVSARKMSPCPESLSVTSRFPFFSFLASIIDECLEMAETQLALKSRATQAQTDSVREKGLFVAAMKLIGGSTHKQHETVTSSSRMSLLAHVIEKIKCSRTTEGDDLFHLYIKHFVEYATGCKANDVAINWLKREVAVLCEDECNILSIHCVHRYRQVSFMRMVSWSSTNQREQVGSAGSHFFAEMLQHYEEALPSILESSAQWSEEFHSFLSQIGMGMIDGAIFQSEDAESRIRILIVFLVLVKARASAGVLQLALSRWYDEGGKAIRQDAKTASLRDFLDCASGCDRTREALLWHIFSPAMMKLMPNHLVQDLRVLAELIDSGEVPREDYKFATSLLHRACSGGNDDDCHFPGLSKKTLSIVNTLLRCEKLREFSEDGARSSVPHFIPPWLQSPSGLTDNGGNVPRSGEESEQCYPEFFSTYEHSFRGNFSHVVFDMILQIQFKKAARLSSSELQLLLMRGIEMETGLYSSTLVGKLSLAGSALGALAIDAQMIVFVAKVAQELSEQREASALSNTHGSYGVEMISQIMNLPGVKFKELFLCLIKHHSGALASLVGPGGQLDGLPWCRTLTDGTAPDFELPTLHFCIQQEQEISNPVPTAVATDRMEVSDAPTHRRLQILVAGSDFLELISLLPDLIEFYLWVHDAFKHLLTREEAWSTTIGDVMKNEALLKRFDRMQTSHVKSLWERLSGKVDDLSQTSKASWNCDDFTFKTLKEAPLLALLSDGNGIEKGKDLLFRIISKIINEYNNFVEDLQSLQSHEANDVFILPKTILAGCVGSTALNLLPLLSLPELESTAIASWHNGNQAFDSEFLEHLLAEGTLYNDPPRRILDPMNYLRERFLFRGDQPNDSDSNKGSKLVLPAFGMYFAREQDVRLAKQLMENLGQLGMKKRDKDIEGPLKVKFQGFDSHRAVISMATGLCTLFEVLLSKGFDQFPGMAQALVSVRSTMESDELLDVLGFPEFDASQWRLFRSLNGEQVAELAHYFCYQLATEGYLYAKYSLSATESLTEFRQSIFWDRVKQLQANQGEQQTLEDVNHFTNAVLLAHKDEICEEASQRASPLFGFLVKSEFCDAMNPVLLCLPHDMTVQNFAPMLQVLQQVRLSLLQKVSHLEEADKETQTTGEGILNEDIGWLWQGYNVDEEWVSSPERSDDTENDAGLRFDTDGASREHKKALSADPKTSLPAVGGASSHSFDEHGEEIVPHQENWDLNDYEVFSALTIQRWWRRHYSKKLHYVLDPSTDIVSGMELGEEEELPPMKTLTDQKRLAVNHLDKNSNGKDDSRSIDVFDEHEGEAGGDHWIKFFILLLIFAAFLVVLYGIFFGFAYKTSELSA